MTMKDWCKSLRPIQLYVVMALTVAFLVAEMVVSHTTHALTLLVDAYHMMCNILSLMGCVVNLKYRSSEEAPCQIVHPGDEGSGCPAEDAPCTSSTPCDMHAHHLDQQPCSSERRLKNTFGWARVDVVMMLSGGVVLASLCFSVVVEALQTLVHIGHQHQMHQPIVVMSLGAVGLLLNGLCYLLIGGNTFHQSSFLHVTRSGDVVLDKVTSPDTKVSSQQAPALRASLPASFSQHQEAREVAMDVVGSVLVIVCSVVVYFTDECVAKYVDPALAIVSSVILVVLSAPYMKESGMILLQTMPDTINIDSLRAEMLKAFPDILNVHDLHVWRLTASKVYTTVHIVFLSTKEYSRITKEITEFFRDHGITHITIQPEFYKTSSSSIMTALPSIQESECLVKCKTEWCHAQHCCANIPSDPEKVVVRSDGHHHGHSHSHSHGHGHSHSHKGVKKNKSEQKKEGSNDKVDSVKKNLDISHPLPMKTCESSHGGHKCTKTAGACGETNSENVPAATKSDPLAHNKETKMLPSVPTETFEIEEGKRAK